MIDRGLAIIASIVVVAGITALVRPGVQTTGVVREGWSGFANALRAASGR